jgi:hypothetical protein
MPQGPFVTRSDGSQSPGTTADPADWTLQLPPCDLTFIRVDHQARLQFDEVEVVIETEFRLCRGGRQFDLDPGDRAGLGPFLALYPAALTLASVDGDGTLRLAFDTGDSIAVPPHPAYEPWQIRGPGTALVVCSPGSPGTLSVWA